MALRVVQWAHGRGRRRRHQGRAGAPRTGTRRLLGALGGQGGQGTSASSSAASRWASTATNSVDEILALDADAVVYAPLLPNPDEVAALLRSGKNVVTPVGWVYPSERQARSRCEGRRWRAT